MKRDVGLDIIVTKMMATEYMKGVDALWASYEQEVLSKQAVALKGLLLQYARAVSTGRADAVNEVSKAMEQFNYQTGPREVQVARDAKGRFSRFLANAAPSTELPVHVQAGERRKGAIGVADDKYRTRLSDKLKDYPDPTSPQYQQQVNNQQEGRGEVGVVRAISRFQDELMSVFGSESDDIVVVVENTPMSEGETLEQEAIGLNEGVPEQAVSIAQQPGAKMSYGLKPGAKNASRKKFDTYNALLSAGMRPDAAEQLMSSGTEESLSVQAALNQYTGTKANTFGEKAGRHFKTAESLGSFFTATGQPQLAALGGALIGAGKLGQQLSPETLAAIERTNFRLRGMKDNLPEAYSDMMRTSVNRKFIDAYNDPNLTRDKWNKEIRPWFAENAKKARALVMRPDGTGASFDDPVAAIASYMERTVDARVSPREYVDRFTRDMAVTSLIREVPHDERAVKLSQKAGYGVPSSGIIIRSDGQAKEMYRGIADDHYLPFSAKALPELRDGQYVRTRTLGGFTSEDITTAVVSGARKISVVSGSGVFTMELRPDTSLTGRLASPEVAAMGERYERILNKVAASGIYIRDLDSETKAKLMDDAARFTGSTNSPAFRKRYQDLKEKARAENSVLTPKEIEDIGTKIRAEAAEQNIGGRSAQQRAQIIDDMVKDGIEDAKAEKVRSVSLNAEGYAIALDALRMQYPSIIRRVNHESIRDFVDAREMGDVFDRAELTLRNKRGAVDSGYIYPGENRANTKGYTLRNKPDEASTPGAPATAAAGAVGAGATGGTGETGVGMQDIRGKLMTRNIDTAINAAAALNTFKSYPLDAQHRIGTMKTSFAGPKDFAEILPQGAASGGTTPSQTGLGVGFDPAKGKPATIITNDRAMEEASKSQEGLTVALTLAYGERIPGDIGWDNTFDDPTDGDIGERDKMDMAIFLDGMVSTYLLKHADFVTTPVKTDELKFLVPADALAVVPKTIEDQQGQAAIDRVKMVAYDDATVNSTGAPRVAAKKAVDTYIKGDAESKDRFLHHQGVGNNAVDDLSILGMLGVQAHLNKKIDGLQVSDKNDAESVALVSQIEPAFFDGTQADVDARKGKVKQAYQEMFGTEYLLRSLGGGGAAPKASNLPSLVAKQVEDQVSLLLQLVAANPLR